MFEHLFKPFIDHGLWIHLIFEGEDGIGKTTAMREIAQQLSFMNHILTRHPSEEAKHNIKESGETDPFRICRKIISDCYYDKVHNAEIIKGFKKNREGGILLQDRHVLMSMLAYNIQSLSWGEISEIAYYMEPKLWYTCDYTVYIVGLNTPFTNKQSENYTPHSNLHDAYTNFRAEQVGADLLFTVYYDKDDTYDFIYNILKYKLERNFPSCAL